MSELAILVLLYAVGILLLFGDVFVPSFGLMSVAGVVCLIIAVAKTFAYGGSPAGIIALTACIVLLPPGVYVAFKLLQNTPLGKSAAPLNPVARASDSSVPVDELTQLIGATGRSVTPLRPVGICEFNGKRISCITDFDMIEPGEAVQAVRIAGSNLAVRKGGAVKPSSTEA